MKVILSCPTLCDPIDYTVHGILQARILDWVAFPFSRGSSQPRGQTQVSRIAGGWILYQLSHKGSPRILEWVAYTFSSGSSKPRNQTEVSCIAGGFFTNWATREGGWSGLKFVLPGRTHVECFSPWAALFKRERRREPGKKGLNTGPALFKWSVFISVIRHSNPQRWWCYPNMTDERLMDSDNFSMEKCHLTNK